MQSRCQISNTQLIVGPLVCQQYTSRKGSPWLALGWEEETRICSAPPVCLLLVTDSSFVSLFLPVEWFTIVYSSVTQCSGPRARVLR